MLADPPYRTFLPNSVSRGSPTLSWWEPRAEWEKVWVGRQAGWNAMFAYFGESRVGMVSPARVEVGALATDCRSELSQSSAKSCK